MLTVALCDEGKEENYSVYGWLREVAEELSDDELLIQLIGVPGSPGDSESVFQMEQAGAGVDVVLSNGAFAGPDYPFPEYADYFADLAPLLGNTDEPRTVGRAGAIEGISYGIRIPEEGGNGWDYIFAVSEGSELKEAAVEFCLAALENKNYQSAMIEAGILPIE